MVMKEEVKDGCAYNEGPVICSICEAVRAKLSLSPVGLIVLAPNRPRPSVCVQAK